MLLKDRRSFIKQGSLITGGVLAVSWFASCAAKNRIDNSSSDGLFFKLSLAQWSFHKALFSGKLTHLDFAEKAASIGVSGIEYVNQFFKDKAENAAYLDQMNRRATDANIRQLLIMVDGEGGLGDTDDNKRNIAVKNHFKWVNAAKSLGCHSIRVNAYGEGNAVDVGAAAVDGLSAVAEYAAKQNINVLVENHGGYSSDGAWLSGVMKKIDLNNCGTLPDFGNFCIKRVQGSRDCAEEYDRYKGVEEMMPYAMAVSAKAHDFDSAGNEIHTDFLKMMRIVKNHRYKGFVGIEYEGSSLDEETGVIATRDLLIKVGKLLT